MNILAKLTILFIKGYQTFISPYLPPTCRFTPTCSQYSIQAIEIHGFWMGIFLSIKRILRCNPFCKGGYDPVPKYFRKDKQSDNKF